MENFYPGSFEGMVLNLEQWSLYAAAIKGCANTSHQQIAEKENFYLRNLLSITYKIAH